MSQGHPDDLKKTIEELRKPSGLIDGENWLRHGSRGGKQAVRIDEMLLIGATKQDIAQDLIQKGISKRDIKITQARVKRHIDHIRKEEHMLPLIQDSGGRWKFDLKEMEQKMGMASQSYLHDQSQKTQLPTEADIERAEAQLRSSPDEVVGLNAVLGQVETDYAKAGKPLKKNWLEITRQNIERWFGKKK